MNNPAPSSINSLFSNAPADFSITQCGEDNAELWNTFVQQVSGTYCHLFGWKQVFERTYGLQTYYLAFRTANVWHAVLPVAVMPRLPGGTVKVVSLPYCNYGGILAAPGVDTELLKNEAVKYLTDRGADRIEFRDLAPVMTDTSEVTMVLSLPANSELLWKQVGDKVRNQVRKAQRSNLTVKWGRAQGDELYAIYAKNMGRLGTPVHSSRFIKEILASFEEQVDVLTVRHEDRAIGAMLVFKHGQCWSDPFASCLVEFNSLNPNMLLYWESLRAACDFGANCFDFGRSHKDSGTYRFKKQWGAKEIALNYHSYHKGLLLPSASTIFYRGHSASKLANIWRRLPGVVQKQLGPAVRRWLP